MLVFSFFFKTKLDAFIDRFGQMTTLTPTPIILKDLLDINEAQRKTDVPKPLLVILYFISFIHGWTTWEYLTTDERAEHGSNQGHVVNKLPKTEKTSLGRRSSAGRDATRARSTRARSSSGLEPAGREVALVNAHRVHGAVGRRGRSLRNEAAHDRSGSWANVRAQRSHGA